MQDRMKPKHLVYIALYAVICVALSLVCSRCFAYESWLERCEPYRIQIEDALVDSSLSTDYYYLMIAESRCTPKAKSSAGALGFWQLMPRTSRKYGCSDPNNLTCATRAAIAYIKRLESEFHSFREVIYAYNMGGHNYAKSHKPTAEAADLFYKVSKLKLLHNRI